MPDKSGQCSCIAQTLHEGLLSTECHMAAIVLGSEGNTKRTLRRSSGMVPSTAFIAVQASRTAPNLHWQQRELKIPQPQFLFLHIHSWQRHVLRDEQVIRLEMYHQLKTGRFRYRSRTCSSSSTIGSKETSVGVVAWAGRNSRCRTII